MSEPAELMIQRHNQGDATNGPNTWLKALVIPLNHFIDSVNHGHKTQDSHAIIVQW